MRKTNRHSYRNKELFQRDPTKTKLLNDGVAAVKDAVTTQELETLRFELSHFVCEGQYKEGLIRILESYIANINSASQPAGWVSGFFGSGKSTLEKIARHLWVDTKFPDTGETARGLANLPAEVKELLKELDTLGKRFGGLHAAAGALPAGGGLNVRLAVLGIIFKSKGLPESLPQAQFCLWLRKAGIYDKVRKSVEAAGKNFLKELNDLYVSPLIAKALLAAQEAATHVSGYYPDKGVAANNAALVAMRLGDYELALEQSEKAVSLDPASPVFLETLADAKRRATGEAGSGGDSSSDAGETAGTLESGGNPGEIQCAFDDVIASYQEALAADSSSSLAWNNLGVVHAACQQGDEARQAFQNSIRANPEYAKGWFNYGSYLLVEGDWTEFLIAEGALGIAGSLDRALRDEGPALSTDEDIYDTGLDLSQALPADWKLGEHERRSAAPITIMLIVLTLFRVVTELAREDVLDRITSVTMNKVGSRFAHLALPGTVGLALSTVLLVVLSSAESKEQLLLIPVAFAAVALPSMIRAMGNSASAEVTPAPILVATAVLVPFGAALPPLAGARGSANVSRWKAAAAPAAIAVLALVAVGVSLVASVPLERATLTALVAILTTTLLPTPPYDGAKLTGWRSQLATIGMGLIAVLFALRLV